MFEDCLIFVLGLLWLRESVDLYCLGYMAGGGAINSWSGGVVADDAE